MMPLSGAENEMATALQLAVERGELTLDYQPKLALAEGTVAGVEALARWEDGRFGSVPPAHFIPLAERAGIIDALTESVLRQALRQWLVWRDQGFELNIAVNISATTLRDVDFPDFLQHLCLLDGVPCEQITVELTEGATQHVVRLLDTLTRFRLKGMGVALDDFGTGYSSLLQLRQLPFTELKIDQCFVADAAVEEDSRLIVKSVIDLAHALGLTAVAEGVEDAETLALLRDLGCDHLQGFYIARPMNPGKLVPWIIESGERWQEIRVQERHAAS
jgi:EAL domain-containing protein (putative c-di-GMP-specific phosphodiesterase class I)